MDKAAKSLSRLGSLPVNHAAIQAALVEAKVNHEYEIAFCSGSYLGGLRQATSSKVTST
jgi:hypothetical protein